MRPIVAAVFFAIALVACVIASNYASYKQGQMDCQPAEPQQVVGPRGERGLPGVNGSDGKPGQDCDCAALKSEAMEYVATQEKRIAELTTRINRLEASQCKCKCQQEKRK